MWHPLDYLTPEGWPAWALFAALFCATAFFAVKTKADLATAEAPLAAISLELAYSGERAGRIIDSWKEGGGAMLTEARRHLRYDSYLIVAYSLLLALGCVIAAREMHERGSVPFCVALAVAWLPLLAGAFDFVENSAMGRMLDSGATDALARRAHLFASLKFLLLGGAVVFTLAGFATALWKRLG